MTQNTLRLDRIEARSALFTELQGYWTVPISESGVVAGLSVAMNRNDKIHVLAGNPLKIFSMTQASDTIQETVIQGLLTPERGNRPLYTMATDREGNVLVHEETVSSCETDSPILIHIYYAKNLCSYLLCTFRVTFS